MAGRGVVVLTVSQHITHQPHRSSSDDAEAVSTRHLDRGVRASPPTGQRRRRAHTAGVPTPPGVRIRAPQHAAGHLCISGQAAGGVLGGGSHAHSVCLRANRPGRWLCTQGMPRTQRPPAASFITRRRVACSTRTSGSSSCRRQRASQVSRRPPGWRARRSSGARVSGPANGWYLGLHQPLCCAGPRRRHTSTRMHTHTQTRPHTHTHTRTHTHTHTHTLTHTHTHTCRRCPVCLPPRSAGQL
jgi:hypothetical protein